MTSQAKKIFCIVILLLSGLVLANPWDPTFNAARLDMHARINGLWGVSATSNELVDAVKDYLPGLSAEQVKKLLMQDYLLETRNAQLTRALRDTISSGLSSLATGVNNMPERLIRLWKNDIVHYAHQLEMNRIAEASTLRIKEMAQQAELNRALQNDQLSSAKEQLILRLQNTKELFASAGNGLFNLMGDKQRMIYLGAGIVGVIAGYFIVKHSTKIVADQIEKNLNTPKLLTETSWVNPFERMKINSIKFFKSLLFKNKEKKISEEIVLCPKIAKQIETLTNATKKIHEVAGSYQNVLLYGEPGTGKTLFATLISHHAGMDYAILSGSNFDQFDDEEAIIQINKLFDWAETRNRDVIIFIDEAETFLGKRSDLSQKSRRLLNAFLHRTGGQSKKFMLICATNRPDMLDAAVLSRLAVKIEFQKPAISERVKLLNLYLKREFNRDDFDNSVLQVMAAKTDGFSGREIAQFVGGLKAEVLGNNHTILSPTIMYKVLDQFVHYHNESSNLKAFA